MRVISTDDVVTGCCDQPVVGASDGEPLRSDSAVVRSGSASSGGRQSRPPATGLTLLEYFDADLSGRDFGHGKPDPEIFLTSARELGVAPENAIVMEDAAAGVQAAKAGGMGAIGIARVDDAELLAAAHADVVVTSLDDVDLAALADRRLATKRA